jgi:hypothetical protein
MKRRNLTRKKLILIMWVIQNNLKRKDMRYKHCAQK